MIESWEWPQWAFFALYATAVLYGAYLHGKPRTGTHNFWITAVSAVIGATILYFGGFWG